MLDLLLQVPAYTNQAYEAYQSGGGAETASLIVQQSNQMLIILGGIITTLLTAIGVQYMMNRSDMKEQKSIDSQARDRLEAENKELKAILISLKKKTDEE